jgi:AcrR family transcriptional regulator
MPRSPASREPDAAPRARRPYAPRLPPDQRREQLIDAALGLILDAGYAGVSIEAIARVAGVTRPVVYDHFPNLGRLLHALVEREERIALAQLEYVVPDDPGDLSPTVLLSRSVELFLEAVKARPATWRIILLPLDGTPAIIRDQVETNRAHTLARIEKVVTLVARRPEFPIALDVEMAARAILALGEEAGRLVLTDPERFTVERYRGFIESVLGLIWPPDAADN